MINCLNFAQRCSLIIIISMYGEYGIYGKIRAIKGKYNQMRLNMLILGQNKSRYIRIGAHNDFTLFHLWSSFHVKWGK